MTSSQKSSILLIYTGGTIGMKLDPTLQALTPFDFSQILEEVPELRNFDQWYKNGLMINGATSKTYTVENATNDAIYTCEVISNQTSVNSVNLVSLGNFEFDDKKDNSRITQQVSDPIFGSSYNIIYELYNLKSDGKVNPGEYCISTNPNNIQPEYFTNITAQEGSNMLVVNGPPTNDFRIFHVRDLKLKGGVTYTFSCWAANIDKEYYSQNHGTASLPKIRFGIESDGYNTQSLGGGYITLSDQLGVWQEYKVSFTPSHDCSWAHITISCSSESTVGNNFVIDNVYFGAENSSIPVTVREEFSVKVKDCTTDITEALTEEITVSEGQIIYPDAEMVIYNTSGLNVTALNGSLQPGVYVVFINGNTTKVMVR